MKIIADVTDTLWKELPTACSDCRLVWSNKDEKNRCTVNNDKNPWEEFPEEDYYADEDQWKPKWCPLRMEE